MQKPCTFHSQTLSRPKLTDNPSQVWLLVRPLMMFFFSGLVAWLCGALVVCCNVIANLKLPYCLAPSDIQILNNTYGYTATRILVLLCNHVFMYSYMHTKRVCDL